MNDIGKKAAKASNLRRTHDLQVHEASDVLRGSADPAASEPQLRSVPTQKVTVTREVSAAVVPSEAASLVARRA